MPDPLAFCERASGSSGRVALPPERRVEDDEPAARFAPFVADHLGTEVPRDPDRSLVPVEDLDDRQGRAEGPSRVVEQFAARPGRSDKARQRFRERFRRFPGTCPLSGVGGGTRTLSPRAAAAREFAIAA